MENATAHVIGALHAAGVATYAPGVADLGWTARVWGDYGDGVVVSVNLALRASYRYVIRVLREAGFSVDEKPGTYEMTVRRD